MSSPLSSPKDLPRIALSGEPFIEVTRGDAVESVHAVAACAMDADGNVILGLGEIDAPVYLRSTAKPFIAAAVIASGAAERFAFEPLEIAVIAASHAGQPFHVEAVASILRKIGMNESDLRCGVHPPYNAQAASDLDRAMVAPNQLHNNCSGKHAGILALCKQIGADPATYLDAGNPAQQQILAFCARVSGVATADFTLAVDGCGIPVYATTLRNAARSFAVLATLEGLEPHDARALQTVRNAMVRFPEYVSGDRRAPLDGLGLT